MRNYRYFSPVRLEGGVALSEHLVESVKLQLQRRPDLHPEERTGVVHDVHRRAVQQVPGRCIR